MAAEAEATREARAKVGINNSTSLSACKVDHIFSLSRKSHNPPFMRIQNEEIYADLANLSNFGSTDDLLCSLLPCIVASNIFEARMCIHLDCRQNQGSSQAHSDLKLTLLYGFF